MHKEQPCLCILAGEGHSWNLLSLVCFSRTLVFVGNTRHHSPELSWTTRHSTALVDIFYLLAMTR